MSPPPPPPPPLPAVVTFTARLPGETLASFGPPRQDALVGVLVQMAGGGEERFFFSGAHETGCGAAAANSKPCRRLEFRTNLPLPLLLAGGAVVTLGPAVEYPLQPPATEGGMLSPPPSPAPPPPLHVALLSGWPTGGLGRREASARRPRQARYGFTACALSRTRLLRRRRPAAARRRPGSRLSSGATRPTFSRTSSPRRRRARPLKLSSARRQGRPVWRGLQAQRVRQACRGIPSR